MNSLLTKFPFGSDRKRRSLACAGLAVAISLSFSAAQAQSGQDPIGQAVKDVAGGIANLLGAILNPNAVAFRAAVKEQRFNDALALYDKNSTAFRQDKDLAPDIQILLAYVRTRDTANVEAWLAQTEKALATEAYRTDAQSFVSLLNGGPSVVKAYLANAQILRDFQDSDPLLARIQGQEQQCRLALQSNLASESPRVPWRLLGLSHAANATA